MYSDVLFDVFRRLFILSEKIIEGIDLSKLLNRYEFVLIEYSV